MNNIYLFMFKIYFYLFMFELICLIEFHGQYSMSTR